MASARSALESIRHFFFLNEPYSGLLASCPVQRVITLGDKLGVCFDHAMGSRFFSRSRGSVPLLRYMLSSVLALI